MLTQTSAVPVSPPQTYLTLTLRNLGFNTTQSNLLSIPSNVLGIITLLIMCYLSEILNSRVGTAVVLQFWALPLVIALYTFNSHTSQWVYFAVVTLITGFPYVHPIQVAWASANSSGVGTRTVSASVYNMFVQAGGIVSVCVFPLARRTIWLTEALQANIYRANDAVSAVGCFVCFPTHVWRSLTCCSLYVSSILRCHVDDTHRAIKQTNVVTCN